MSRHAPFTAIAEVYDAIMADIDYDDWAAFILRTVTPRGWRGGPLLDLGCGTGNATFPMYARGFEVVGLDASAAMLRVAREKLPPVTFLQGTFSEFSLGKSFTLIYSVFDALNNLLSPRDFMVAARRIFDHLEPGGFFMFDVNTEVGLRELWEAGRAEGWSNDVYYRWDHSFDEASRLARVEAYCEKDGRGFTEVHYERAYDAAEVRGLLASAGFIAIETLLYPEGGPALEDAERIWVVAQRPGDGECG